MPPVWILSLLAPPARDPLADPHVLDRRRRERLAAWRDEAGDVRGARRVLFGRVNARQAAKAARRKQERQQRREQAMARQRQEQEAAVLRRSAKIAAQAPREAEREAECPLRAELARLAPLCDLLEQLPDPLRFALLRAAHDPGDFARAGAGQRRRLRCVRMIAGVRE